MKEVSNHFSLKKHEVYYVQFLLKLAGYSLSKISISCGVSKGFVLNVVYGRRRSSRIEAEIAQILGHEDWNHLVIEARLAVSGVGRPTKIQIEKTLQQAIKDRQELIKQKRTAFKQTLKEAV